MADEFVDNKYLIYSEEEDMFLTWVELYFGQKSPFMDPGGERSFAEFDTDGDGFISEV